MELKNVELMSDPSLRFLRPSPPKMSVRPSEVRRHLYSDYASMPPPILNDNKSENKTNSKRTTRTVNTKSKPQTFDLDSEDNDETNDSYETESDSESIILLDK